MPNVSRPMGFRPVMYLGGACYTGQVRKYHIPASDGTAVAVGDLVKLVGTADANGVQTVTRVSDGAADAPIGSVVGFVPDRAFESQTHRSASTLRYALVANDPNLVYEAQADEAITIAADIGLNAAVTVTAINTTTGVSNMQVDASTKATTATLPVKIIGLVSEPANDIADTTNLKVLCIINNHPYKAGVAGV